MSGGPSLTALLGAEQRRFWARDAIRWMVVLSLVLVTTVNVIQIARSSSGGLESAFTDRVPNQCVVGTSQGLPVVSAGCIREQGGGFGTFGGDAVPPGMTKTVSYTHLTLPTNREV